MKKKFFVTITITTIFVSLFSIMSTQAALPSNFRFITPSIACSGAGTNAEYMEMKQTHEISAILNLRIGHPDDESYLENKGFVCLYVPIEDSYPPTQSQAIKCINFINQSLAEGRKVLVHCAGGYARSTTIVAIWLISQGYRAEQAINLIFLHPDTGIDDKQRDFLYQFDSQYPDQTTKVDTSMVVSSNYSGNQTFNVTGTLTGEFYPSYAIIGRIIYSPVELSTTWGYSTFIMTDVNGNF